MTTQRSHMGRTKRLDDFAIVQYLLANPAVTSVEAGEQFGRLDVTIRAIAKKHDVICDRINKWHRKDSKEK
jgi:hypothetical protein